MSIRVSSISTPDKSRYRTSAKRDFLGDGFTNLGTEGVKLSRTGRFNCFTELPAHRSCLREELTRPCGKRDPGKKQVEVILQEVFEQTCSDGRSYVFIFV
jgi:hypothetical protein